MLIIIEIKGTDWDKIRAGRGKRNVQRYIRRLPDEQAIMLTWYAETDSRR